VIKSGGEQTDEIQIRFLCNQILLGICNLECVSLLKIFYLSILKNSSLHYHVYIFIIISKDVIQLYIIWKAMTSTTHWYRKITVRHCLVCPYKRILPRPKTYETPCISIRWFLMVEEYLNGEKCWVTFSRIYLTFDQIFIPIWIVWAQGIARNIL
jgi:hypothetical protein